MIASRRLVPTTPHQPVHHPLLALVASRAPKSDRQSTFSLLQNRVIPSRELRAVRSSDRQIVALTFTTTHYHPPNHLDQLFLFRVLTVIVNRLKFFPCACFIGFFRDRWTVWFFSAVCGWKTELCPPRRNTNIKIKAVSAHLFI